MFASIFFGMDKTLNVWSHVTQRYLPYSRIANDLIEEEGAKTPI